MWARRPSLGISLLIFSFQILLCMGGVATVAVIERGLSGWRDAQVMAGSLAPEFTLTSTTGNVYSLVELRGTPVLVTFGASWCPACRREAPLLDAFAREYPQVAVFFVANESDAGDVQGFKADLDLDFAVLMDRDGTVTRAYRVSAYPTTFLIDAEGRIRQRASLALLNRELQAVLPTIGVGP